MPTMHCGVKALNGYRTAVTERNMSNRKEYKETSPEVHGRKAESRKKKEKRRKEEKRADSMKKRLILAGNPVPMDWEFQKGIEKTTGQQWDGAGVLMNTRESKNIPDI